MKQNLLRSIYIFISGVQMSVNQRDSVDPEHDILPGSNVQATILFTRGAPNPAATLRSADHNSFRDQDISTDSSMKSISINLP